MNHTIESRLLMTGRREQDVRVFLDGRFEAVYAWDEESNSHVRLDVTDLLETLGDASNIIRGLDAAWFSRR